MSLLTTVLLLWEPLPRPRLSVEPVSWITPGLDTFLQRQVGSPDVAFLLRREGDGGFLEVVETNSFLGAAEAGTGDKEPANFLVYLPGTYSCGYLTHTSDVPSVPSDTVTIKEYSIPPRPVLTSSGSSTVILPKTGERTLVCQASLIDVEFQLRQGEQELNLPSISTSPEQIKFYLKLSDLADQSPFTCGYRLLASAAWSRDSEPVELIWSDELQAGWIGKVPAGRDVVLCCKSKVPGDTVEMLCGGKLVSYRVFIIKRTCSDMWMRSVAAQHTGNYTCHYISWSPERFQTELSNPVELIVEASVEPETEA